MQDLLATAGSVESPADNLAVMLIVLGVVAVGVLMSISIRSRMANRHADRTSPGETLEQIRRHTDRSADADAAAARLIDTAQQAAAQLDVKAERLAQLIGDADERIATLQSLTLAALDAIESKPQPYLKPPVAEAASRLPADLLTRSVYELADRGASPVEIAQEIDEQVGKVELILGLRRSTQST